MGVTGDGSVVARVVAFAAVVWCAGPSLRWEQIVWAADGTVTIVAPKPNDVVGSNVTVTWVQEKAGRADHVHVFVDRGQMKPVKTGTSTVIKGLSKGSHEITVQAYSSDHEPLDAKASVTVKVE